jgi:pimeloyl-ACP methyl ester carboxylesterase
MMRWIKRIAIALVSLVVIVVISGATIETVMRRRAAREFPPPGRLVDIGGRKLQIDCRGSGSPTVVLESGLDDLGSLAWAAVHDSIARTTRVCAYSRPGIMWSDPMPGAFDARRLERDLHAGLVAAGETPPWVMAGHSLGGPYTTIFESLYPNEVAGLVFVDASHPEQIARLSQATGKSMKPPTGLLWAASALAWTGALRLLPGSGPPKWPAAAREAPAAYRPRSMPATVAEARALEATLAEAGSAHDFGARPLVVLTAMAEPDAATLTAQGMTRDQAARMRAAWKSLHDDEATWSSRSRHELVPDATHYIQFDRPDVVIAAVREVVARVRADSATVAHR